MSHIKIHRHQPIVGRGYILAAVYWDLPNARKWDLLLRERGIDSYPLASRRMTPDELSVLARAEQLGWVGYFSWDDLIRDEYLLTRDEGWTLQLYGLSSLRTPLREILLAPRQIEIELPPPPEQTSLF